jgi:hypothetical protein
MIRRMDTRCGGMFDGQGRQQAGKSKLSDLGKTKGECHNAQLLYYAQDDTLRQLGRGDYLSELRA